MAQVSDKAAVIRGLGDAASSIAASNPEAAAGLAAAAAAVAGKSLAESSQEAVKERTEPAKAETAEPAKAETAEPAKAEPADPAEVPKADAPAGTEQKGAAALLKGLRSGEVAQLVDAREDKAAKEEEPGKTEEEEASEKSSNTDEGEAHMVAAGSLAGLLSAADDSRASLRDRAPLRQMMATSPEANLHAKLSQMAAFLRESKDDANRVHEETAACAAELQELRQESKVWKEEADHLRKVAADLQKQCGNSWSIPVRRPMQR